MRHSARFHTKGKRGFSWVCFCSSSHECSGWRSLPRAPFTCGRGPSLTAQHGCSSTALVSWRWSWRLGGRQRGHDFGQAHPQTYYKGYGGRGLERCCYCALECSIRSASCARGKHNCGVGSGGRELDGAEVCDSLSLPITGLAPRTHTTLRRFTFSRSQEGGGI